LAAIHARSPDRTSAWLVIDLEPGWPALGGSAHTLGEVRGLTQPVLRDELGRHRLADPLGQPARCVDRIARHRKRRGRGDLRRQPVRGVPQLGRVASRSARPSRAASSRQPPAVYSMRLACCWPMMPGSVTLKAESLMQAQPGEIGGEPGRRAATRKSAEQARPSPPPTAAPWTAATTAAGPEQPGGLGVQYPRTVTGSGPGSERARPVRSGR